MPPGHIDRALIDKRKKILLRAGQERSALRGIVRINGKSVVGNGSPRESKRRSRQGNAGGRGMTCSVSEARVGQPQVRATALVIKTQGISTREAHAYTLVDVEGRRCAHAGNYQPVLAGRGETREIGLMDLLRGRRGVFEAHVRPRG